MLWSSGKAVEAAMAPRRGYVTAVAVRVLSPLAMRPCHGLLALALARCRGATVTSLPKSSSGPHREQGAMAQPAVPRAAALNRPLVLHRQQSRGIFKPWKNSLSEDSLTEGCHIQAPQHRPVRLALVQKVL